MMLLNQFRNRPTRRTLLLGLCSLSAQAATPDYRVYRSSDRCRSWVRADAGLPGGVRVNALGQTGHAVVAGTDAGLFVSPNRGQTWHQARGSMASGRCLACCTTGPVSAFAAMQKHGVLVSSDRGMSWQSTGQLPAGPIRSLLASGPRLYAGTNADGVFLSESGGNSWRSIPAGLPVGSQVFTLTELSGLVFAGLYARGLFAWDERPQQWHRVEGPQPLALISQGQTLIAGQNPGGVLWTADQGKTWHHGASSVPDKTPEGLTDTAPVWAMEGSLDLAVAGVSSGIYYSEDGGRRWLRAINGLPARSPGVAFSVGRAFVLAATG